MNWLSLAVAGGLLAFRLVEAQDQPRPPEGRPGEPRPEGRRPDQPRPPEGRPGEPRPEGRRPDQPRPPEGRPGEPRPEGRRPDQPRPPEGRPGEPRPEGRRPDKPRPPEGRPGEPRPEGRRPDQPRPPEGRPGEPRPEDKEMAERQERARQQVNRIQEEMENHAKALRELGEKLMRANREMAEAGGAPWQWRSRGAAFQGGPGMPGPGFGFPSRINPPGEQPGANPSGSGLNPDAARRFEQLERRLDEVMKRLDQMSREKR